MQTVAAIVDGQHLRRMLGVAQRLVEISDRVEGPAVADPAIDRETDLFALRIPGVGHVGFVAECGQRRTNNLDAATTSRDRRSFTRMRTPAGSPPSSATPP